MEKVISKDGTTIALDCMMERSVIVPKREDQQLGDRERLCYGNGDGQE
jgi:hypothetical protein